MAFDAKAIEERIDRVITGSIEIADDGSGLAIKRLVDAMEIAKLMSLSKQAIPSFMRNEPGLCYAAVVRAIRWGMDPYFIAEQSYLVNNRGEEKVAYMASLIVAVINARAPLEGKLRARYEGEGPDRICVVYGLPKGEKEPLEYRTPTLKSLMDARGTNDRGQIKGSPLYQTDPDQQLWYYGARSFCRRHFPEVLAGVYDVDEFEPAEPKDVTPERPTLSQRLKGQKKLSRGFNADHIERETKGMADTANETTNTSGMPLAGEDDPVHTGNTGSEPAPSVVIPPEGTAGTDGAVLVEGQTG